MKYLFSSFKKFKDDFLSKSIYDIVKSSIVLFLTSLFLIFIPKKTTVGEILRLKITLTILEICIITIIVILVTIIIYYIFNRKKLNNLKYDLHTDELTGLRNNRALNEDLPKIISWSKTEMKPFSIILLDIDNFKQFNSDYSQSIADEVLMKFGTLLASDSRITDQTYRQHVKGDEFVIIAKDTILENAVKAADRKRENIYKTGLQIANSETFNISVSCGVTEFNPKTDNEKILLDRAFDAMKIAKQAYGKNSTKSLL